MTTDPTPVARRWNAKIERASSHAQVADVLREAILAGDLRPGESLREVALSSELGVSRNTVREAARLLAFEGLVRYEMNRGVAVAELDDDDIDECYCAREALEGAGIDALMADGPPPGEVMDELRAHVAAIESGLAHGDPQRVLVADRALHARLVAATGNARLRRWHDSVQDELRLALSLAEWSATELGRSGDDHEALVSAIATGRRDTARATLREHLAAGAAELHRLRALVQEQRQNSTE